MCRRIGKHIGEHRRLGRHACIGDQVVIGELQRRDQLGKHMGDQASTGD